LIISGGGTKPAPIKISLYIAKGMNKMYGRPIGGFGYPYYSNYAYYPDYQQDPYYSYNIKVRKLKGRGE
ncbi:hypothetical protein, partial [Bacillus toyonensis]|uniref:hypothetical protein n=1 Tax=Bacillus toyonensis TaxID=155322 RepID=UPI001155F753